MLRPGHQVRSVVAQEAAEWFVMNRGGSISVEDRAAFSAWLKTSPLHVEEYLKTATLSRDLHAVTHGLDADIDALILEAGSESDGVVSSLASRRRVQSREIRTPSKIRSALLATVAAAVADRDRSV